MIAVTADDPAAAMGVNDRVQLADAEAELRGRINRRWMLDGVTMVDPSRTYIDATVVLEPDVRLLPGTILEGRTSIAAGAVVGPDTPPRRRRGGRALASSPTPSPARSRSATTARSARSPTCAPAPGSPPAPRRARSWR